MPGAGSSLVLLPSLRRIVFSVRQPCFKRTNRVCTFGGEVVDGFSRSCSSQLTHDERAGEPLVRSFPDGWHPPRRLATQRGRLMFSMSNSGVDQLPSLIEVEDCKRYDFKRAFTLAPTFTYSKACVCSFIALAYPARVSKRPSTAKVWVARLTVQNGVRERSTVPALACICIAFSLTEARWSCHHWLQGHLSSWAASLKSA